MPKTFYIGIKALIIEHEKLLLLKCTDKTQSWWDLPGGRMELSETIDQALRRELSEELPGIKDIIIGQLVGVHRHPHDLTDGHGLMLQFYKVKCFLPEIALSAEHSSYKWVTREELKKIQEEAYINPEIYSMLGMLI